MNAVPKLYEARSNKTVHKLPVKEKIEGATRYEIGFPVCTMSPYLGDQAEAVAELLNMGEAFQKIFDGRRFSLKDRVRKHKGSSWQGHVVGFYSTELNPFGYCVESEREPGNVQVYPEAALELVPEEENPTDV